MCVRDGDGNGMYGGLFYWVIVVFVRCCCNKGGNFCIVGSLFIGVGLLGLPYIFLPTVLELLSVSIMTEIACRGFLVFPTVCLFTSASGSTFGWVVVGVDCWDEDAMKSPVVGDVILPSVKAGIRLIWLKAISN